MFVYMTIYACRYSGVYSIIEWQILCIYCASNLLLTIVMYVCSTYVGLLSALIVLAGSLTAVPSSWVANTCGKPLVMSLGGACLAFAGFALLVVSDKRLGTWEMIIPYLIVYGIGRGTWVCIGIDVLSLCIDFYSIQGL